MTKYSSTNQPALDYVLDSCDTFEIFSLDYKLGSMGVTYMNITGSNRLAFERAGMTTEEQVNDFASMFYGYRATCGDWPNCKNGDTAALLRLIRALWMLEVAQDWAGPVPDAHRETLRSLREGGDWGGHQQKVVKLASALAGFDFSKHIKQN